MARVYRFFTRELESLGRQDLTLSPTTETDIFNQLTRVLRARSGDHVALIPKVQSGHSEYHYSVAAANKKEILLSFREVRENRNELSFPPGLILCLPNKPDKLEFILQKAVEIGATRITLVEGDFSQMKHPLRRGRLEKIMIEAAEQSERAVRPELVLGEQDAAPKLTQFLRTNDRGNVWVAMERLDGKNMAVSELMQMERSPDAAGRVENGPDILIGPEGGFSDDEKKLIQELHLKCFSLGPRILRMETAAILALGLFSLQS